MVPEFGLTFGKLPDSWEREHAFTSAAACFDYVVCTPDGRVSAVQWAGANQLLEKSFRSDDELRALLWRSISAISLRPGITDASAATEAAEPSYFVRVDEGNGERVLRAKGRLPVLDALISAIDAVLDCEAAKSCAGQAPVDSPEKIRLAQQGWLKQSGGGKL